MQLSDLKSHDVVFYTDCQDATSFVTEVRGSSAKPSANGPRFCQSQRDVPERCNPIDLRQPGPSTT